MSINIKLHILVITDIYMSQYFINVTKVVPTDMRPKESDLETVGSTILQKYFGRMERNSFNSTINFYRVNLLINFI